MAVPDLVLASERTPSARPAIRDWVALHAGGAFAEGVGGCGRNSTPWVQGFRRIGKPESRTFSSTRSLRKFLSTAQPRLVMTKPAPLLVTGARDRSGDNRRDGIPPRGGCEALDPWVRLEMTKPNASRRNNAYQLTESGAALRPVIVIEGFGRWAQTHLKGFRADILRLP